MTYSMIKCIFLKKKWRMREEIKLSNEKKWATVHFNEINGKNFQL
jgi:hypothetical protein